MEKKSIYNQIAKNVRLETSELLLLIQQCEKYNALSKDEAQHYRKLAYEFYKLSSHLDTL